MIPPEPFESRLVSARMLGPSVREMVLERADGRPFRFDPGQWVNLVLPLPGGEIKRAYSVASPPLPDSPRFELAVTRVTGGPGSEHLHALPEGATLRTIGPHGHFTRRPDEGHPSIFVGTGTGVTPLRSMIRAAIAAGAQEPLWLLFGARHEEDVLYRAEMEAMVRAHPNVRYEITLSRPGEGWQGRRGYVQAHLREIFDAMRGHDGGPSEGPRGHDGGPSEGPRGHDGGPSEGPPNPPGHDGEDRLKAPGAGVAPHVYVCGLDRMVSSVRDHLRSDLGLDRKRVHAERYD